MTEILFLMYIINQEGMAMNEAKVSTVMVWPILKMVKDLQLSRICQSLQVYSGLQLYCYPPPDTPQVGPQLLAWNTTADDLFAKLRTAFTTAP